MSNITTFLPIENSALLSGVDALRYLCFLSTVNYRLSQLVFAGNAHRFLCIGRGQVHRFEHEPMTQQPSVVDGSPRIFTD
jgi:hypothetical protein